MQEIWERWQPVNGLENKYTIDRIEYTIKGGFKIILSDSHNKEKQVAIIFKNGIYAHREADEKFMQHTMHELNDNYGPDFYGKWTFFKITNSSYLKWLSEESYGLTDSLRFIHISILAENAMIDIADNAEPSFEFIV